MKRLVALFLSLVMMMSLASNVLAEAAPTVITVWSNDAHSKDIMTKTVEDFNAGKGKELGIQVELSVYGSDYYSTLDIALNGDGAPYIFKCNKIPQYARSGKIAALEDLPGGPELAAPYAEMASEGVGLVDGKTYALPFKANSLGLAVNLDMFKSLSLELPETWDDLLNCAKVITENGNGLVYGYGLSMAYTSYALFFILPMASTSTGSMHFNHGTGRYDFSALTPFMNMMMTLIDEGYMFPGYETMNDDVKRAQFAAGNIGMIPVMSADVGVLKTQFPATFDWTVIPFPTETRDVRYKMYSHPSTFYVVNQQALTDGVAEQTMAVMNLLLGEENLLALYDNEKDMITRADVKAKSQNAEVSKQWKAFGDSSCRYTGYGTPDGLITLEGDTYKDVFDKILTGMADPETALADLDVRYNAALDDAVAKGVVDVNKYIVPDFEKIIAIE